MEIHAMMGAIGEQAAYAGLLNKMRSARRSSRAT